ncbi:MAG: nitroreductase family protein [Desulfobacter sp.]|nr:MAG: nitroreductase family protein [Desulfobacter sp.]
MNLFEIDQQTCNKDGICAAVCPAKIIDFRKGRLPVPIAGAEKACIKCGHCVAVCPTASLTHREIPVEHCPPVQKDLHLSAGHCEHFLRSRRSIRVYKNKAVPRNDLQRLIEMARYAPSGRNSQDAEWLVLENRDGLRKLAGIAVDWMRWVIANQPDLASSMHLGRAIQRWENGIDIIFRDAPALIVTHAEKDNHRAPTSCNLALAYLELAATGMGLGSCWAGYFNRAANAFPPMMEALALPEGHTSFGAVMVGYPKFNYHRLPLRRPPRIIWR